MGIEDVYGNAIIQDVRLVSGSASAVQFPDLLVVQVNFKARAGNIGKFYLGETASDLYWELSAGETTGWVVVKNMNHLFYQDPSGSVDQLAYWTQR